MSSLPLDRDRDHVSSKKRMPAWWALCAVLTAALLLAIAPVARAQSTAVNGTIEGNIVDVSGGVMPGVTVTITNTDAGGQRIVVTNERGVYRAPLLPLGAYHLVAELAGFKKFDSTNNKIDAAAPATISAVMQIGATSDTIEVQGTVSAIQTESASLGKLIEGKQVSDLQLNGRNPIFLARLKPGDRFVFAGTPLEFVRVRDMKAWVRRAPNSKGAIPRWMGSRLPLSGRLAALLRGCLGEASRGV